MQKKASQNQFYNDILANNPGTIKPEKNGKKKISGAFIPVWMPWKKRSSIPFGTIVQGVFFSSDYLKL